MSSVVVSILLDMADVTDESKPPLSFVSEEPDDSEMAPTHEL